MEVAIPEHRIYKTHPYVIDSINRVIYIPLINYHRQIVMYAMADLDLAPRLLEFRFCAVRGKRKVVKDVFYARSSKNILLHHLVMNEIAPDGQLIDHCNGFPLDNRRINLRFATSGENNQNKPKRANCSSKFIGVYIKKDINKWVSRISYNQCSYTLGYFTDETDAAKVYDAHAILFFGVNARTNESFDPVTESIIFKHGIPREWMVEFGRKILPFIYEVKRDANGRFPINLKHGKIVIDDEVDSYDEYLNLIEQFKSDRARETPITRNSKGIAVVRANHKGYVIEATVDDDVWKDIGCHTFTYNAPYMHISVKGINMSLHRYLYKEYIDDIHNGYTVDHANSEFPLDCRLQNLRPATKGLQSHNQKKRKGRIDKYKGVNYMKGKFHTFVDHISHGSYESAEEAAEHANYLFKQKYGAQARLNVIDHTKKTTKENRIPDEMITLDFILELELIKDLRDIAVRKGLNKKAGGPLRTVDMASENFEWLKMEVARLLFHVEFQDHSPDPPVRKLR